MTPHAAKHARPTRTDDSRAFCILLSVPPIFVRQQRSSQFESILAFGRPPMDPVAFNGSSATRSFNYLHSGMSENEE